MRLNILQFLFFLVILDVCSYGQSRLPNIYVAKKIHHPITVDGKIDESIWSEVSWSEPFVDIEAKAELFPAHDTRIKMVYDSSYLYIAAQLEEPHIWAYLKEKNKPIFRYDNDFEVFIDPDGDHCNYYELELNAINTIWELSLPFPYRNGGSPIDPDNMHGMKSACFIKGTLNDAKDTDEYWSLEIALPFQGFNKYSGSGKMPKEGSSWRLNFSRVQWDHYIEKGKYLKVPDKSEHNWVWSPQYEINMHAPEHWGYLFFNDYPSEIKLHEEWVIEEELVAFHSLMEGEENSVPVPHLSDQTLKCIYLGNEFILSKLGKSTKTRYFLNQNTCFWKSE